MSANYAAIWSYRDSTSHVGSVDVTQQGLRLRDSSPSHGDDTLVGYGEIENVRLAELNERLADLKTLVVEYAKGGRVRIAALGLGAALELAARLAESVRVSGAG